MRTWLAGLVFATTLVAIGYAGWHYVQARDRQWCPACERPIHAYATTIVSGDGGERTFCCLACALSERRQSNGRVRIARVTDYVTRQQVDPERAVIVRGSDVVPCAEHDSMRVGDDKQPMHTLYDRCLPSMLAFANRDQAEAFIRQHGGEVLTYQAVAATYNR
jgi:hypothetical protein